MSDPEGMKTLQTFISILVILSALSLAQAETLYSPLDCQGALTLSNLSTEPQNFWLLFQNEGIADETPGELLPGQTRTFQPDELPTLGFAIKSASSDILAFSECHGQRLPWSSQVSSHRSWALKDQSPLTLWIQNLNPEPQTLMLRFYNKNKALLHTQVHPLGAYFSKVKLEVKLEFSAMGTEMEVTTLGRVSVMAQQRQRLLSEKILPVKVKTSAQRRYFLLANPDQSGSFIVGMEDPALIQQARDLIKTQSSKLMIAQISYGPQSENRSLMGDTTPYSWRVHKVTGFSDFAHISCDGSPQVVEEQIPQWLQQRQICFWNFHLKKELTPAEVKYGLRP